MVQVRDYQEVRPEPAAEGVTMRVVIGLRRGALLQHARV